MQGFSHTFYITFYNSELNRFHCNEQLAPEWAIFRSLHHAIHIEIYVLTAFMIDIELVLHVVSI